MSIEYINITAGGIWRRCASSWRTV